jgi:hypothetical protein
MGKSDPASPPTSGAARAEQPVAAEPPTCWTQPGEASAWQPPSSVGRYRIEDFLGRGGMGQVYSALDEELMRRVAVKFMLGIEPNPGARTRFMIEARATAQIQHPNVITIHDVGECDQHPCLVMEYLVGRSLDKLTKPMHWSKVFEIGVALSSGLAAAHRRHVLHCDIKPDNAMLTREGHVKLLDFGVAKFGTSLSTAGTLGEPPSLDAPAPMSSRGGASPLVGTPSYRSPEGWRGIAKTQSDVYSLGALLFELCAGRTPYADAPLHALAVAVQRRDAPRLTEVASAVDPRFAAIIARCLAREPEDRYPSGGELYEALMDLDRPAGQRSIPASHVVRAPSTPAVRTMVFREIGPLVVSVNSAEAPTDDEWDAYLRLCREKMANESIGVLVVTAGGVPTPLQRIAIRELVDRGPVLAAIVTNAPAVQNIITVMGWQNPGIRNCDGLEDAFAHLGIEGEMAERVRGEIKGMQREVA